MDLDGAEVAPAQAALVRERADNLPRLHLVALAHGDAVRGDGAAATAGAALAPVAVVPAVARTAIRTVAPRGTRARGALARFGVEQQGGVALGDHGERCGDVGLGNVVVVDVVATMSRNASICARCREGRRDARRRSA